MITRKLTSILITALILFGATTAFGADYKTKLTLTVASSSPVYDEAYTFTQPADFTITQSGWNELGSIKASYGGSNAGFDTSKKLAVTVSSTNNFTLKADGVTDTISYFHATNGNDTSATTTFEFTAAEITKEGTSKTVGVNVGDYSTKASGTYTDEIIYSVEVKSTTTTTTVTWNASDITDQGSTTSFTKDSVTVTSGQIDFQNSGFYGPGTFTTTLGNFTKIEVQALDVPKGEGWSNSASIGSSIATWTGTASNSVSFTGDVMGISSITFTIE